VDNFDSIQNKVNFSRWVDSGVLGEPLTAWMTPILDRAQQLIASVKHLAKKLRDE
jgi:hypothetical protein